MWISKSNFPLIYPQQSRHIRYTHTDSIVDDIDDTYKKSNERYSNRQRQIYIKIIFTETQKLSTQQIYPYSYYNLNEFYISKLVPYGQKIIFYPDSDVLAHKIKELWDKSIDTEFALNLSGKIKLQPRIVKISFWLFFLLLFVSSISRYLPSGVKLSLQHYYMFHFNFCLRKKKLSSSCLSDKR